MPRFRLLVAYDGTDFHGWQRQEPPGLAPLRTVQGELERAVRDAVGAGSPVVGASRTDSGVHAEGQVAAFTAETRIPVERLAHALNARLPDDMQVRGAEVVDDAFDPISDCTSKCYRYRVRFPTAKDPFPPLFERRWTWWTVHRLELEAMRSAAGALVGTHDFAAFAAAAHGRESTVRSIHGCTVSMPREGAIEIDVAGNGFLYNMVRIVAGTLVEAGRGRIDAARVREALAGGDRRHSGPTLPPCGLCLRWIHYGPKPEAAAADEPA